MNKFIAFIAISATLLSCSHNDDNSPSANAFFNLKVGNLWVYKNYMPSSDGPVFNHQVDTVRITGEETFDGVKYYKFEHKIYQSDNGTLIDQSTEYKRINENGHLVNDGGRVLHPGTDLTFRDTIPFSISYDPAGNPIIEGTSIYSLKPTENITVEGVSYTTYPYEGYYTPTEESNGLAGIGEYRYYSPGIGLVYDKSRYICCPDYIESRLIYYNIN